MTRAKWSGATITRRTLDVLHRDGPTCWLCGHPTKTLSRSLDHVMPVSTHPHLEHNASNWRLAHLGKAGRSRGCSVAGCHCPGNTGRRATPWTPPPSRDW